jgi:hypothetical protein
MMMGIEQRATRVFMVAHRRAHIVAMVGVEGFTPYVRKLLGYQARDIARLRGGV